MWIIELNIGVYRFTREISDPRRRNFRFGPRNMHRPVLRHAHAA
jgi:hypothetical protein